MNSPSAEPLTAPSAELSASGPPPSPPQPHGPGDRDGSGASAGRVLSAVGVLVVLLGAWYGASIALAAAGKGSLLPLPHEVITRGISGLPSAALFAGILAVCLLGAWAMVVVARLTRVAAGRRDDSPV